MTHQYEIIERLPSVDEYRRLCTAVGWESVINFEVAHSALANSQCGVVAMMNEQVVGMGRIVGDGAIFFYIQDIAVDPLHQGIGVGTKILDKLFEYLRDRAPEKAFVGLLLQREAFRSTNDTDLGTGHLI